MKRFMGAALCTAMALAVSALAWAAPVNSPQVKELKFITNWGSGGSTETDTVYTSEGTIGTVKVDTTEAFLVPRFIAAGNVSGQASLVDTTWHFTLVAHEAPSGIAAFPGSATSFSGATECSYVRWQIQVSYDDGNNWYSTMADTSDMAPAELGSTDSFPRVFNSRTGAGSLPALELNALGSPGLLMRVIQYAGVNGAMMLKLIGYRSPLQ